MFARLSRYGPVAAIAAAAAGAVLGIAAAATATGTALGFAASRGYPPQALSDPAIARYAGGTVIGSALLAAAGAGAGSLIRQQTGAIIAVVAWGLVIELVVGATVTAVGRFLPYTAAAMMAGDTNGGGMPQIPRVVTALPYPAAIAVLIANRAEMCDAALALRCYVPPGLAADARHRLSDHGLPGVSLDAATEACWLKLAIHALLAGVPADKPPHVLWHPRRGARPHRTTHGPAPGHRAPR